MCGWNLFLVLIQMVHSLYILNGLKMKYNKFISYIRKKIQDFNDIKKCNIIINLPKLCWKCNIIVNEATPLFTQTFPCKVSPKWSEMDWIGP